MNIFAVSDTHQKHRKIKVPKCDVFVFAGDLSEFNRSTNHYIDFNDWLGEIDADEKLIIAGNHDELFQKNPEKARSYMTNCKYLEDDEIIINGVKFYGSPWQKWFYDWAFNLPAGSSWLKDKWDIIPNDVDVLITHTPPFQICDSDFMGENLGCELLVNRVFDIKPKLHVFGHIHASAGKYMRLGKTLFVNVSNNGCLIELCEKASI